MKYQILNYQSKILAIFLLTLCSFAKANAEDFGSYSGQPEVIFSPDGRHMELLKPLIYTARDKQEWVAPAGYKTDGATIPQVAWSFVGGPFSGAYRQAAIIHDVACDEKNRPWKEVHRTFYYGMRASGVSETKAKTMYAAVYIFGPKWELRPIKVEGIQINQIQPQLRSLGLMAKSNQQFFASVHASSQGAASLPTEKNAEDITVTADIHGVYVENLPIDEILTKEKMDELSATIESRQMTLEEIEQLQ